MAKETTPRNTSENHNHLRHLVTMVSPKVALQPVDRAVADAAHAELTKFVDLLNPGVVDKRPDMVLNFDKYLPDLQKTTAVVKDFLDVGSAWK